MPPVNNQKFFFNTYLEWFTNLSSYAHNYVQSEEASWDINGTQNPIVERNWKSWISQAIRIRQLIIFENLCCRFQQYNSTAGFVSHKVSGARIQISHRRRNPTELYGGLYYWHSTDFCVIENGKEKW